MIKKYWVYAFFVCSLALFAFTFLRPKRAAHGKVSFTTFQTSTGWGYDVFSNDSLFIHQEYMPALEGRNGFATEAQATKTAQLVVSKMKKDRMPVITKEEMTALLK